MTLSPEQLLELAQKSLERFAFPSSRYDSVLSYFQNLEPMPTQRELVRSIEDIEVESEDEEGNPATGWLRHRDLEAWTRDFSGKLDTYTEFSEVIRSSTNEQFLEEFAEAVSLWKNYQPLAGTIIEIESWWATAKALDVASLARSKIMDLLKPSEAAEWLKDAPSMEVSWDDTWSTWTKMVNGHRFDMALAWAGDVLEADPASLRRVRSNQSPADYRQSCIDELHGALVAAQAQGLSVREQKGAEAIESLLAPHSTLSLGAFPWDSVFEAKPTRQTNWQALVVSPEDLQARVEFIVKHLPILVEDWKQPGERVSMPPLGDLRTSVNNGSAGRYELKPGGVQNWLSRTSGAGRLNLAALQEFLELLDKALGDEPTYRNAFEAGFLSGRFEPAVQKKPAPRF